MSTHFRSHRPGDLRAEHVGSTITLAGWVHRRRDHGGLVFVDLRDSTGLAQIVFHPEAGALFETAGSLRSEDVIQITGTVRARPDGTINANMPSGEIEVEVQELTVLNRSETPPFEIDVEKPVNEELRLQFRYLDLRKERMQRNLRVRHQLVKKVRDLLDERGFIEVETPDLVKGTPEGSREYLVPSRLHPGTFYVLPQSPQQFKQLLMVAGMDRYFQIARCFRDEDQRGDRQPEFTQMDMEMSFTDAEEVMQINEELFLELASTFVRHKTVLTTPFPRMTWDEAMHTYGSDKPDLRSTLAFTDVTDWAKTCGFAIFQQPAESGGFVKVLRVPGAATYSRKQLDDLTEAARSKGAKGLAYIQMKAGEPGGPVLKNLAPEALQGLLTAIGAMDNDLLLFGAGKSLEEAVSGLGVVRLKVAETLGHLDPNVVAFLWVTDFPLFEVGDDGSYGAAHHPFTQPKTRPGQDPTSLLQRLKDDPLSLVSHTYDIVLNGVEVGGGSIRIHDRAMQSAVFDALRIDAESQQRRFGHMLKAFSYGAPPHGGVAWGIDRILQVFLDEPNIREVIAFPKNQTAQDLLMGAPSELPAKDVAEMHIRIIEDDAP